METDKEFDKMFRSKLNDFEAGPSADVWSAIEDELNVRKRKIKITPFMGIAASLLMLLSAGLLLIPHQIKTGGKHLVQTKIYKGKQSLNEDETIKSTKLGVIISKSSKAITAQTLARTGIKEARFVKYGAVSIDNEAVRQRPAVELSYQPLSSSITLNKPEIINPVVIVKGALKLIEQPLNENINEKPVLAAVQLPAAGQPVLEAVKPKHKIKSFGDLVNAVVAKVDKRKDKLIEFTDVDDDDESTITGINLGILKIKKEK